MKIPAQITAGDSVTWDDDPSSDNLGNSVDSGSWTLKYDFQQSGVTHLSVTAVSQGTGWRTALTKAQTAAWAAGVAVYWQAYAESGSSRVTLGSGSLKIKPNVSNAVSGTELRSQAEQDLAAVQAAMRAIISGGAVKAYTIGNRSLSKMDMSDLIMLESRLKYQVAQEKAAESVANGLGNPRTAYVRFK